MGRAELIILAVQFDISPWMLNERDPSDVNP